MPYKSKAQAAYFNIHKSQLEKKGVNVNEWNQASKGKDLPAHHSGKGTRARLNTAAEKMLFKTKHD
jgi:hypothetical protein